MADPAPVAINELAPAVAVAEAEILAWPEAVWDLIAGIERWPEWNPDVKSAVLEGPLVPGTTFRWKAGPGTITSQLIAVDRPRLIAWTGRTMGIRAVHVWRVRAVEERTLVRSEESWEGLLPSVLRGMLRRSLHQSLEAGVAHLKAEAERVA